METQKQTANMTSLWEECDMVVMQNHASIFHLFKFADS